MSPDTAYGVANRTGHSVINAAFQSELKELFDGLVAALEGEAARLCAGTLAKGVKHHAARAGVIDENLTEPLDSLLGQVGPEEKISEVFEEMRMLKDLPAVRPVPFENRDAGFVPAADVELRVGEIPASHLGDRAARDKRFGEVGRRGERLHPRCVLPGQLKVYPIEQGTFFGRQRNRLRLRDGHRRCPRLRCRDRNPMMTWYRSPLQRN